MEAGTADELGLLEVLARTADVEAGELLDAGARLEVTQEQTASAEVWTMRPVEAPHAAMTPGEG